MPAPGRLSENAHEWFCFVILFFTLSRTKFHRLHARVLLCFVLLCSLAILCCASSPQLAPSLLASSLLSYCTHPSLFPTSLKLSSFPGWQGEGTHSVKCLPCQQKDPSSILRTHIKMLSMVVHTCSPSAGETESSRSLDLTDHQPSLYGELQANKKA